MVDTSSIGATREAYPAADEDYVCKERRKSWLLLIACWPGVYLGFPKAGSAARGYSVWRDIDALFYADILVFLVTGTIINNIMV